MEDDIMNRPTMALLKKSHLVLNINFIDKQEGCPYYIYMVVETLEELPIGAICNYDMGDNSGEPDIKLRKLYTGDELLTGLFNCLRRCKVQARTYELKYNNPYHRKFFSSGTMK